MQLKLQVPSLELHVPGPQDQAGWRSGPWDTLGHAAWLFLPASCHGMLRVTAGPPSADIGRPVRPVGSPGFAPWRCIHAFRPQYICGLVPV